MLVCNANIFAPSKDHVCSEIFPNRYSPYGVLRTIIAVPELILESREWQEMT